MDNTHCFPNSVLAAIRDSKILGIRAGNQPHRFIAIWPVVVEDRLFVRSWSQKPGGWYHTLLEERRGTIDIDGRRISIRAVHTRSGRLKTAVDRAYVERYNTPGSIMFTRGFRQVKRRNTTVELVPSNKRASGVAPKVQ